MQQQQQQAGFIPGYGYLPGNVQGAPPGYVIPGGVYPAEIIGAYPSSETDSTRE